VTYNACLNPAFTVKFLVRGMVIKPSPLKLNSVTMVQSTMLDSKPIELPTFVHTWALVPFMTSIAIPVITILVFFAMTSNMIPFRLIHLRFVELPTEFLTQEGVAKAGNSELYAVGAYEEVVVAVGYTERDGCVVVAVGLPNTVGDTVGEDVVGDADGIAFGLALDGLIVGKNVGVAGLFAFFGNIVGLLEGAAVVGKLLGLAVGLNEVGNVDGVAVGLTLIGLIVDGLADIGLADGFLVKGCVVPELLIRIFATQLLPSFGFMMLSNVMTTSNPMTLP